MCTGCFLHETDLFRQQQLEYLVNGFYKENVPYGGGIFFSLFLVCCMENVLLAKAYEWTLFIIIGDK